MNLSASCHVLSVKISPVGLSVGLSTSHLAASGRGSLIERLRRSRAAGRKRLCFHRIDRRCSTELKPRAAVRPNADDSPDNALGFLLARTASVAANTLSRSSRAMATATPGYDAATNESLYAGQIALIAVLRTGGANDGSSQSS